MAAAPPEEPKWEGGVLLYCGGTDFAQLGRTGGKTRKEDLDKESQYPNLLRPTRLKTFNDVKIMFIAAGPAACHCFAGDSEGNLYSWGRNERGQLGHGDFAQRNVPTKVAGLAGHFVIGASGGKNHSAAVTRDGSAYAWGINAHGQCGTGRVSAAKAPFKEDIVLNPTRCIIEKCQQVACGIDFTLWLCDGKIMAAGNGQYGVLGDGQDHSYNAKDSSIQILFEAVATPHRVAGLDDVKVLRIAAGHNHCLAYDDQGGCYSWGNGGYGRLGHKIQQDEDKPRKIEVFTRRNLVPPNAILAAGGTSSFCTGVANQVHCWGKLKVNGDNQMYPVPVNDLVGWNVRSFACGPGTFAAAADSAVITWGAATNGELGFGPNKKSSANPAKCEPLDGGHTEQVACGIGFTMFLVDPAHPRLAEAPEWESDKPMEEPVLPEPAAGGKGGGKRKAAGEAAGAAGGAKGKKAK
ncbi:hypothetical protein HYH02_004409 [Chlamydomonas schloesseri]|uniref:Regulator of chromosome condensation n=1 Tax=Chlamydomonas schloesseri TaxID=2026947 RepID=A0A835WPK7_9CHLO|nr:hypothetical protein HYH02_004409 [Chlamydomonas schloesseri]|eukprot:KAG2451142.1 hypothetical protein HYH02_004409 [Chlamydomonas schloesseri]